MMPEMDGVEAMKLIKAQAEKMRKDLPIVALTANAVSTAKEMFMQEGFSGFVSKPIDIVELERVLKRVLPKSLYTIIVEDPGVIEPEAIEKSPIPTMHLEQQQKEEKKDKYAVLKNLGFDVETGLMYSQNDEQLYLTIVKQFADEGPERKTSLLKFLEAGDMGNYAIIVHALKSTSKLIGNEKFSEKAKTLELAAKAGNLDFVKANHDEFIEEYAAIFAALKKEFGEAFATDDDGAMEFEPEGDAMEFEPDSTAMEFNPKE
jgi:HPt (histidine-containing phosphotransfer) domain-containing protein